jgi:hypothetical protein
VGGGGQYVALQPARPMRSIVLVMSRSVPARFFRVVHEYNVFAGKIAASSEICGCHLACAPRLRYKLRAGPATVAPCLKALTAQAPSPSRAEGTYAFGKLAN